MADELDANISELRRDGRFKIAASLEFWKVKFAAIVAGEAATLQRIAAWTNRHCETEKDLAVALEGVRYELREAKR